jgi:hypothetical protein
VVQEARDRVSRKGEDQGAIPLSKPQGLARLDGDFVEDLLNTQLQERLSHEIVAPHTHSAGGQYDVRVLKSFTETLHQLFGFISHQAQTVHLSPRTLGQSRKVQGVGFADLTRPWSLRGRYELVSGGQDRHARLTPDGNGITSNGGEDREVRRAQTMARALDPSAHFKIFGLGADVLLKVVLPIDVHLVSLSPGLLNHDDQITGVGHLGTGVDLNAGPRGNLILERRAGAGFADASQGYALGLR